MTRIIQPRRPIPDGVITENYTHDEEVGLLKTGKEAEVYLVERHGAERSCLFAHKRYRPVEERAFKNDAAYRADRRIDGMVRDGGVMRKRVGGRALQLAMDKRTRFGRKELFGRWIEAEFHALRAVWEEGANVPYVVARTDDGILMEYVGTRDEAAPRLVQWRGDRAELPALYDQVRENLRLFARAGFVHADLSPYNTLLWEGRLWFIDLPQAVRVLHNESAIDFLHRDCVNIATWFARKGLDCDPEDLFVEALDEVFRLQMGDMFLAR